MASLNGNGSQNNVIIWLILSVSLCPKWLLLAVTYFHKSDFFFTKTFAFYYNGWKQLIHLNLSSAFFVERKFLRRLYTYSDSCFHFILKTSYQSRFNGRAVSFDRLSITLKLFFFSWKDFFVVKWEKVNVLNFTSFQIKKRRAASSQRFWGFYFSEFLLSFFLSFLPFFSNLPIFLLFSIFSFLSLLSPFNLLLYRRIGNVGQSKFSIRCKN